MSDYTPTTEEVRTDYALYAWSDKFERSMRSDSFDRWLAEHDRQKQAEAWVEGWCEKALQVDGYEWNGNPYGEVSE